MRDTDRLKLKSKKMIYDANTNQNKRDESTLASDEINFRKKH